MRWMIPLLLCAQVATAVENLIDNGGFENPSFPVGVVHYPSAGSLGAWETTIPEFEIWANPTAESLAVEGKQHLEVDVPVFQSIPTVPSKLYRLSFWHSARTEFDNILAVAVDSTTVQTFSEQGVSASAFQWKYFTTTFVAAGSQTTITFSNTPITLSGNGAHIDNVRVVPVVDSDGDGLDDDYEMGYGRYHVIQGGFTWEQAKADAEARGGHIATFKTSAEWNGFLAAHGEALQGRYHRIGLEADMATTTIWKWITDEQSNFTFWDTGQSQPDRPRGGGEDSVVTVPNRGYGWHDVPKSWSEPYILEFGYPTDPNKADTDGDGVDDKIESDLGSDPNDPFSVPAEYAATLAAGATTFEVVQGTYTWHQAKADAVERGGRLALFPTGDLYDRVIAKVRQNFSEALWLGLTDEAQEGVWRWLDGSLLTYSRWIAGEPNNVNNEDFAVSYSPFNTWNDLDAGAALFYLLERRATSIGALPWLQVGQAWTVDTAVTHDGVDSAKAQTTDGQSTFREYTVTGPAVVDFWWKVSSEKNFDKFSYSLNGVNQETISGEVDWSYRTLTLPAGTHTIRWTYAKDASDALGQDAGWLDEFAVYPAEATLRVSDGATTLTGTTTVDFGAVNLQSASPSKTFTFANDGYVPLEILISLPEGSPFSFEEGSSYELLLGRGESIEVPIFLSTGSAGTKTAQLSISAPDSVVAPPTLALQGVLLGQKIAVARGGNSLASGQSIDMGLAPRTLQFTISNTGNVGNLEIAAISSTGNFQITQQPQTSIAPQASTTFTVLAQATAFGNQVGGISITSNDPDAPTFTIPLTAKSFAIGGEGILSDSMSTSGAGGAAGWDLATTVLPSGQSGQAIKTGATPNNGGSVFQFTSQTAGVITWTWKVSAQEEFDWLLCEVDGQEVAGISTKNGVWQTQVVNVPSGANVRWVYRKDASGSAGEDAGYLADVEFRSLAANQSFSQWAQTQNVTDPQQRMPKSGLQAMFGWLGGFGADEVSPYSSNCPFAKNGSQFKGVVELGYRFLISKTADGTQQILYSPDMGAWTTRRISQRIVGEDADRLVIEATAPSGTKGFFKVVGGGDTSGIMVRVQGGTLPPTSVLAGTAVGTFLIAATEVTWGEWQEVRAWAVNNGYLELAGVGAGTESSHPVIHVNWYDAVKWCNAKSEMEGLAPVYFVGEEVYRGGGAEPTMNAVANGYRLPTEAEWEWAARGGVRSQGYVFSGSNDLSAVGWFDENATGPEPRPVATKLANELGIYDMSGNVWEWCWEQLGPWRAIRGGAWGSPVGDCPVRNSGYIHVPETRAGGFGLRVARNAED
jgi:hypothetical protein